MVNYSTIQLFLWLTSIYLQIIDITFLTKNSKIELLNVQRYLVGSNDYFNIVPITFYHVTSYLIFINTPFPN